MRHSTSHWGNLGYPCPRSDLSWSGTRPWTAIVSSSASWKVTHPQPVSSTRWRSCSRRRTYLVHWIERLAALKVRRVRHQCKDHWNSRLQFGTSSLTIDPQRHRNLPRFEQPKHRKSDDSLQILSYCQTVDLKMWVHWNIQRASGPKRRALLAALTPGDQRPLKRSEKIQFTRYWLASQTERSIRKSKHSLILDPPRSWFWTAISLRLWFHFGLWPQKWNRPRNWPNSIVPSLLSQKRLAEALLYPQYHSFQASLFNLCPSRTTITVEWLRQREFLQLKLT